MLAAGHRSVHLERHSLLIWGLGGGLPRRVAALVLWLVLVVAPPLLISRYSHTPSPTALPVALGSAAVGAGERVLRLEPGTRVPLRVDLESPILNTPPQTELAMTLAMPIEVALRDGSPDGRYRIGDGDWHEIHDGILQLRIDRLSPRLEGGQAVVRAHAKLSSQEFKGETR